MLKVLPVSTQKEINGYLFYSLPFSILRTEPLYDEWIMEHYISCHCLDTPTFKFNDGVTYWDKLVADDILDINWMSYDMLPRGSNIADLVKCCIDSSTYCTIFLDEYYVPGRPSYQLWHHFHEIMIFGYDDTEFYYLAFTPEHVFAVQKTTIDCLNRAYWHGRDLAPPQEYRKSIIFMKKLPLMRYRFSADCAIRKLHCYAHAVPDVRDHLVPRELEDKAYYGSDGIMAGIRFLERGVLEHSFYPYFHTWFEHKFGLYQRLLYLKKYPESSGWYDWDRIISEYSAFVEQAGTTRMMILKLFSDDFPKDARDGFESKILETLKRFAETEKDIFSVF